MKISIGDMDFFYKKTFIPNIDAMQLSSYHKQIGDDINFITEEYHIGLAFDLFYIIKNKKATPKPPGKLLDNIKVKTIGLQMKDYDNYWELNEVICSVRPDYLLYPSKEKDSYYNANLIRFYHKGKLLSLRQPFENTLKHHKKTVVVDSDFGDYPEKNIVLTLTELLNYKNIVFEAPIQIKKIINLDVVLSVFLKLDFSPGTIFKFRNDYGSSLKDAEIIFQFIKELKEKNKDVAIGRVPFKTVTTDHWDSNFGVKNGVQDLIRCLKIMSLAKKEKISILLVKPDRQRFESPFGYYLDGMEYWSKNFKNLSYIEYMLLSAIKKIEIPGYGILNNPVKWITPNTNFLLSLLVNEEIKNEIGNLVYHQGGDKFLDHTLINWNTINKYQGKLEKDIQYREE